MKIDIFSEIYKKEKKKINYENNPTIKEWKEKNNKIIIRKKEYKPDLLFMEITQKILYNK
jgi:hypothetical protein